MKKYKGSNATISEFIFNDYIDGIEVAETDEILNKMPLLVSNGLACKISGYEDLIETFNFTYRAASRFMIEHNEELDNNRRELDTYEFGGKENLFAKNSKELVETALYSLDYGVHYCQLDKNNYMMMKVSETDDEYYINYEIYTIGKKCKKWKSKLLKYIDKYQSLCMKQTTDRISYMDGREPTTTIFKPFDQLIMKDKDKVIKYIDNWKNNIPIYYEKYNMIAKLSIILYGNPGSGKSSFCKALAKYLEIPSITSINPEYFSKFERTESRRRGYVNYTGMKTIYSIDDIDCVCKSREDDSSKENDEILSNLLSFLDNPPTFYFKANNGVKYPVSIVVATTNYYDRLDEAIKRYGRFDLKIQMNDFDKDLADQMCEIYGLQLSDLVKDSEKKNFTISPAYLQSLCLENLDKSMKEVK